MCSRGKEDLEAGRLQLTTLDEKGVPLVMGLLLLHLKFQTEPLLASSLYDKSCKIILETKARSLGGLCSFCSHFFRARRR